MVLDATARLVTVSNKKGPNGEKQRIVCSEPSPDGLTAQSAALTAQGGTQNFGFGLGAASSEAAASIGLRTQTITLLRDGYYRLCEAYMNGLISREAYYIVLAEIDSLMISLLVIDTVAGAPRAPAIAVTPGIPGISSSLQVSDGAAPDTSSGSTGSIAISGADPVLEIETIGAARGALGEYDAEVLLKALDGAKESSRRIQCIMMLADPQLFKDREKISTPRKIPVSGPEEDSVKLESLVWALPRLCKSHLDEEKNLYVKRNNEVGIDVQKQLDTIKTEIKAISSKLEEDNSNLNSAEEKLLELSEALAKLAISTPHTTNIK